MLTLAKCTKAIMQTKSAQTTAPCLCATVYNTHAIAAIDKLFTIITIDAIDELFKIVAIAARNKAQKLQ